jgi:hypothetical protein
VCQRKLLAPGWIYFDVLWFGDESALKFKVRRTPASVAVRGYFGIDWYGLRVIARGSGYTWSEFCELDGGEIASAMAHHRIRTHVSALVAEWQAREAEIKAKSKTK